MNYDKQGVWIKINKQRWLHCDNYKCSLCGNTLDMGAVNAGRGDANYCPNCGAHMSLEVQYGT